MPEELGPQAPDAGDAPRPESARPAPINPATSPPASAPARPMPASPAPAQTPHPSTHAATRPPATNTGVPGAAGAPRPPAPNAAPRPAQTALPQTASPQTYIQGAGAKESLRPKPPAPAAQSVDLRWVWTEVRKRVFIKVPFSRQVADIMEASTPIILDEDHFVVGLPPNKFPLSSFLTADQVRNTIEAILQQAAGRRIHFEVIEGTSAEDWHIIRQRRERAEEAVIAMAQQSSQLHHYEDVLNQIAGEIRGRVSATRDRNFPQVRAQLLLDFVPLISDASDMLFTDPEAHEARRILARTIDRIAGFLEIHAMTLAIEIERYRREHSTTVKRNQAAGTASATVATPQSAIPARPTAPRPTAPPASHGAPQQPSQPAAQTQAAQTQAASAGNASPHNVEAQLATASTQNSAETKSAVEENRSGENGGKSGGVDAPPAPRDT